MYEAEVNRFVEGIDRIPFQVQERFRELRTSVIERSVLPWGEHCTECVWPTCYNTCELYTPREDGACRLFSEGMVRVVNWDGLNPYILRIKFKPWGKLWTVGNANLYSKRKAAFIERMNLLIGRFVQGRIFPDGLRRRLIQKLSYWKRVYSEKRWAQKCKADFFLLECYNPNDREVNLTLTIRLRKKGDGRCYQRLIGLQVGFNRVQLEYAEIEKVITVAEPFEIEIVPNDFRNMDLYFGLMDFVRVRRAVMGEIREVMVTEREKARLCKCIVWDLDNTLWDGVLVEDGPGGIRIKDSVIEVIKLTDQRGILHSIASKNNAEDALRVLKENNIADYFLYPQVNWEPKSVSIAKIATLLNIGIDSLMFVDDQVFEREEVRTALPEIMVIDAAQANGLPEMRECQVPVTEESKSRRQMYRKQEERNTVLTAYNGDYIAFLRECRIRLMISNLDEKNIDRVFELIQRTNQMNFSGNRYARSEIEKVMKSSGLDTYVIKCEDKFGSYGIVGFSVINSQEPRLLDLMFSCRIQGKKVEHAFLSNVLEEYKRKGADDFFGNYRKTAKNENAGRVFEEMGFVKEYERDGVTSLRFDLTRSVSEYEFIEIYRERNE